MGSLMLLKILNISCLILFLREAKFRSTAMNIILNVPVELLLIVVSLLDTSSRYSLKQTKNTQNMYQSIVPKEKLDIVINDAILHGYTDMFKWLMPNPSRDLPAYSSFTSSYCVNAASAGSFEILKYICINEIMFTHSIVAAAAGEGRIEIIGWLISRSGFVGDKCCWNETACANAAANGHFETLKYLHKNGCQWDERSCASAAAEGHFEILKYLRENDVPGMKILVAMLLKGVISKF